MNHALTLIALLALTIAIVGCIHEERARNQGLPLVEVTDASARHGFICTPTLTPKLGPDRPRSMT